MWRSIGSVNSKDDKSIRSNRSRQQVSFEPFHKHKSTDHSRQNSRSFCFDYFQKKRQDIKNMTYDSRAKSQNSLRVQQSGKEDMFTSMRNILNKEQQPQQSLLTSKDNRNEFNNQKLRERSQKKEIIFKQTQTRMRNLKKQQQKLKQTFQNQFVAMKNMFFQLQDKIHKYNQAQQEKEKNASKQMDGQFLKEVVKEAIGIQKYFLQMDRKKQEIMSRLTH